MLAAFREPDPKVEVLADVKLGAVAAHLLVQVSPEQHAAMTERAANTIHIKVQQPVGNVPFVTMHFIQDLATGADKSRTTGNNGGTRMRFESRDLSHELSWKEFVPRIL